MSPSRDTTVSVRLGLARAELVAALASMFPAAASAPGEPRAALAMPWGGGRTAAMQHFEALDPSRYARTRNFTDGAVSRLSPWLRHGVLSLAEVRDAALARVDDPKDAEKLISELAWRDYWQQVYAAVGDRITKPMEPPAAFARAAPCDAMPADVLAATTGMACIDEFVRRLHDTGWLHNHERMWLASWLVHVRGVPWRVGADWFLSHLVDGDPASNHLSWQWVAGTFSAKPYLFNRENLERFTSGAHCRRCPAYGECDVEGSYDDLAERLFVAGAGPRSGLTLKIKPSAEWQGTDDGAPITRPLVWLTLDSVSPTSPAAADCPEAPKVFVIDPVWLESERPSLKRLVFLWECLADVSGIEVHIGDPRAILPACAASVGCDGIAVAETPCPRVRAAAADLAATLPLKVCRWPTFCDRSRVNDLGRFSRYWQKVSRSAMQPTRS
jgi:deoxyribodipyrimidine photo-lyase